MATIIVPNFVTQKTFVGLNTYQYTIQTSGMHMCKIEVDHRSASTMTISIVQAGSVNSTLATLTLPGSTNPVGIVQASTPLQVVANCAVNDTISFVLTSSAPIDQDLNTVKVHINIHTGST